MGMELEIDGLSDFTPILTPIAIDVPVPVPVPCHHS